MVSESAAPGAAVNTDEWRGYSWLARLGFAHRTVRHTDREWARDDDGDGVREVHEITLEGIWAGLRNYLQKLRCGRLPRPGQVRPPPGRRRGAVEEAAVGQAEGVCALRGEDHRCTLRDEFGVAYALQAEVERYRCYLAIRD